MAIKINIKSECDNPQDAAVGIYLVQDRASDEYLVAFVTANEVLYVRENRQPTWSLLDYLYTDYKVIKKINNIIDIKVDMAI